ncbi:MAG: acetolactate synthase small subunit [Clostridiales Family XIII bacterium]|jgi:acetolactate synthase-1/3 small subunit|nr:acetolactate synthase small subunit [Clostridiales Family XIII bacterium]
MKHTIAVLVENKAGVLTRISGLFARRGFNIDSLAVGPTDNPCISRVTIIVDGDDYTAEQVTKQLGKLIDVLKVRNLQAADIIRRELLLVKVELPEGRRGEIIDIAKIMDCEIVDISHTTLTLEHSDWPEKIDLLIDLLSKYRILEIARTGAIALQRGADSFRLGCVDTAQANP